MRVDVQSRQVVGGLVHAQDHGRLKVLRLDAVGDVSVGGGEGVADLRAGWHIGEGEGAVGIGDGSPGIDTTAGSEDVENYLQSNGWLPVGGEVNDAAGEFGGF